MNSNVQKLSLSLIVCISLLFGCKKSKINTSDQFSRLSVEEVLETPSYFQVPVHISLTEIARQVNEEFSGVIFEENTLEDSKSAEKYLLKISKRENITIESEGDHLKIKVPLQAWAKASVNMAGLGMGIKDMPETNFSLDAYFTAKPEIGKNYVFNFNAKAGGFDWVVKPSVKLGFFEISIASMVEPFINKGQKEMTLMLEKEISQRMDLKTHIMKAWQEMQNPVLVSQPYQAWLSMVPESLSMTRFENHGNELVAIIGISGKANLSLGQQTGPKTKSSLPSVVLKEQMGDDFEMNINSMVTFEQTSAMLMDNFAGKNYPYRKRKSIKINSIKVSGLENELLIKAGVSGDLNDTIMLKGRPYYDQKLQSLRIELTDFEIQPESKVERASIKLAKGIYKKELEKALQLPLKDLFDQTIKLVDQTLVQYPMGKGLTLNGQLLSFDPTAVLVTPQGILTQLKLKGNSRIEVRKFDMGTKK
jgi:hypothetical protein